MNAEAQVSSPALDRTSLPALEAKTDPTVAIPKGRQAKDSESKPRTSPEAVVRATILPPAVLPEREPWLIASGYGPHSLDRAFKANLAKLTFGLSPAVMAEQTFDWMVHFAFSPGKQLELAEKSFRKSVRLCSYRASSYHGYQRACVLITGQASMDHLGHQVSHAPGRPNLHLLFILSQTLAGKRATCECYTA